MKKLFLSLVLFGAANSAFANHHDWSLGGGVGVAIPSFSNRFNDRANSSVMGGLWVRNHSLLPVGIEAGYDFLDFSRVTTQGHYAGVGALFSLMPSSSWHPSLLVGGGFGRADSHSRFAFKARAGVDYALTSAIDLGLYLNYHLFPGKDVAPVMHVLSPMVGLSWAFGAPKHHASHEHERVAAPAPVARAEAGPAMSALDSDGDGVPDAEDQCPRTPRGAKVNALGCPAEQKAEIKLALEFASGSTTIAAGSEAEIERAAKILREHAELKGVVEGHTDTAGNAAKNTRLSQERAEAVKAALEKAGAHEGQLTAKGFGSGRPVASNKTKEGRAKNRRVVLSLQ